MASQKMRLRSGWNVTVPALLLGCIRLTPCPEAASPPASSVPRPTQCAARVVPPTPSPIQTSNAISASAASALLAAPVPPAPASSANASLTEEVPAVPRRRHTEPKIIIGADGVRRLNPHYQPKECGEAPPNPYALYLSEDRDGSCEVCKEPYRVPRCPPDKPAMILTEETLRTNTNSVVSFHGTLAYLYYSCTLRGGPCKCSNTCGGKLELFPSNALPPVRSEEEWEALEQLPPEEQLAQEEARRKQLETVSRLGLVSGNWAGQAAASHHTSKSGQLFCGGDEGSVCCPIALHSASRRLDVVVTGKLLYERPYEGTSPEYRLHLRSICRLP